MRGCIRLEKPKAAGWGPMEKCPSCIFYRFILFQCKWNSTKVDSKSLIQAQAKLPHQGAKNITRTSFWSSMTNLWEWCGFSPLGVARRIFDGSCEHITNTPINPQHRRAFETASLQSPEHQIWSRAAQDPGHDWTIPSSIEFVSIYLGGSWVLLLVWSRSRKSKIQLSRICSPVSSTTGADRNHCATSPVMGKCS